MAPRAKYLPALAVVLLISVSALAAGSGVDDAYDVMARHAEAVGGLDRLRAEEHVYSEASIAIEGLAGTVRHWSAPGHRSRSEIDLAAFAFVSGDDGESAWELDHNGKLRVERDPDALARREVARRMSRCEHFDRDSETFTATLEGTCDVNGRECYAVRLENTLNIDVFTFYYDSQDFLLLKQLRVSPDGEEEVVYSDYREVDGLLRAFKTETTTQPTGQTQRVDVTLLETGVEADPSLFAVPEPAGRDFRFASGGDSEDVHFRFIENHLFLDVTIDGTETLWVLDTGASASVIDSEFADALGLEKSGTVTGQGAGSTVEVAFVQMPAFSVGGIEFDPQTVASIEVSPLFRRMSELEVAGILGYDFLSRFTARVDYANETLTFYEPAAFAYEGDGTVLEAPLKGNCFSVPATVDGVHSGSWNLDLGATGATFHYPYAEETGLLERPGVEGVGFGAGGRIASLRSAFDTIEFGGFVVERPLIAVPRQDMPGGFGGGELIGNLGNRLFRHFVLYLDYENQRVIVERGADFERAFPTPKAGFATWLSDAGDYEIFHVAPGTPGADAGLRIGDVVLRVDGVTVKKLGGLLGLSELGRAEAGTVYKIELRRGDELLETELTLREIY